jgi:uncharacterized Zn finger protein
MIEWVAAAAGFLYAIDSHLGEECPSCSKRSWMTQKNLGHTIHGQNFRVRCGVCGNVFKVPYRDRPEKPGPDQI